VKAKPKVKAKGKKEGEEEEKAPLVEESGGLVKSSGGTDADPAPSESVPSESSEPAPVPEKDRKPEPEPVPEKDREPEPTYDVPELIDVNEFRERSLADLLDLAAEYPIHATGALGKSALVFDLLSFCSTHGTVLEAEGILEQAKENYAMLRDPKRSFRTAPDDFYIGGNLLKQHGLGAGQQVKVRLRAPRERDKYLSALEILTIEGNPPEEFETTKSFDQLTSLFPEERFVLERPGEEDALAVRLIDIVAPIGKGQRALIVAPPRGGKTILLKEIAKSIAANHRETKLIILLLDERPEEVTDFEEAVDADVFSSTFDEPAKRHAQVSDLVLERARRLVELGQDVVILLDSLTRLARGYNNSQRGGGPIGSGGLSPNALQKSRKFFGAARNLEEGGSLTIVATCLIETESRMDDIIFEELKGTGNMEIRLDRELAESRIFPAVHIPQSGTRNDDRLYHPQEMEKVIEIRRQLTTLPIGEALETLLRQLAKNSTNAELLMRGMI
jgi:transcription termination factor Rho